jgi:hypothetical protein
MQGREKYQSIKDYPFIPRKEIKINKNSIELQMPSKSFVVLEIE